MSAPQRRAILRRLDALALTQLCQRVVELEAENEELRRQLAHADDAAEFWQANAIELAGDSPGLTQSGRIVRAPAN